MINEELTFKLFGYTSFNLKTNKSQPFVRSCDKCGKNEIRIYLSYVGDLCGSCAAYKRYEDANEHKKSSKAQLIRYDKFGAKENQRLVNQETWNNTSEENRKIHGQHVSAGRQNITYNDWEDYAKEQLYCPKFDEECRESNREKYDRRCFLTGLPEEENKYKSGKQRKLSVHHVDMDKGQGCNGIKWKLVPLCLEWHGKVHTKLWEARIIWLLDNVWNNEENIK